MTSRNNTEIDTYSINNFKRSTKQGYEYLEMEGHEEILRLRVTFFIRRERLEIVEKIINLKYNGFFQSFIEGAIMDLVELDLNSPESIAQDFCKQLLKRWMDPAIADSSKRKSLQNPVNDGW